MLEDERTLVGARAAFLQKYIRPFAKHIEVFDAFWEVDRRAFVPKDTEQVAYKGTIIDIGEEATMSEPSLMCEMIEFLDLKGSEKVLEIGTASGYGAALLSRLASEVHTMEYNPKLAEKARETLQNEGHTNVHVHLGDGALGLPGKAPFDAIIVTAGARKIPRALKSQLAEGGKMVLPVGYDIRDLNLIVGLKSQGKLHTKKVDNVVFVPLMSHAHGGWTKRSLQRGALKREVLWRIEENSKALKSLRFRSGL